MRHRPLATLSGIVLLATVLAYAQSSAPPAVHQEVDALVASEFGKDSVGSVTVGIVQGATLAWAKSYGFANMENRTAATTDTAYRIGSITKQFTGLVLLQLAERGKLNLTDPVEKFVPEVKAVSGGRPGSAPMTLLQLATMMSGLSREPETPFTEHSVGAVKQWDAKVLQALPKTTYAHETGTKFLYSNIGYATLGIALGRAAGRPFTEYVEQEILTPLGMTHTAWEPNATIRPLIPRAYTRRDGKPDWRDAEREVDGRGYRVPNGALWSTVGDLAKFVAFELGQGPEGILKKETQHENYSRVYSANGDLTSGYGLGFQATRRGTLVSLGHGGSTAGFRTAAQFHRESKIGVIVLRSAEGGTFNPGDIALRVLEKVVNAQTKRTN